MSAPIESSLEVVTWHRDVLSEDLCENILALDVGALADSNPNPPGVYREPGDFSRLS